MSDKADSYVVDAGDLLFTRYSGNPQHVGAAAVVPPEGAGVLHPDKLIRVVANEERVLPEWIAAYVAAGKGRREIEKRLKTTAGQVGISGSQLKTVPIAVPSLSYQKEATAKIGLMHSERERLRKQLAELTVKEQALRRSILADAFSGQLVPQPQGRGELSRIPAPRPQLVIQDLPRSEARFGPAHSGLLSHWW